MTLQWQNGLISNFDYLMQINKMAGRTFGDLMQYPVMPHVLADYTSQRINLADSSAFRYACLNLRKLKY